MLTKAFLLKRAAAIGGTSPSATTKRCLSSRARVVVVGSGRMGSIRASMLYANPRFDLAGIVDLNWNGAKALADTYQVRTNEILLCKGGEQFEAATSNCNKTTAS
jgi:hypothetical protein